jgi:hypothetical protein
MEYKQFVSQIDAVEQEPTCLVKLEENPFTIALDSNLTRLLFFASSADGPCPESLPTLPTFPLLHFHDSNMRETAGNIDKLSLLYIGV